MSAGTKFSFGARGQQRSRNLGDLEGLINLLPVSVEDLLVLAAWLLRRRIPLTERQRDSVGSLLVALGRPAEALPLLAKTIRQSGPERVRYASLLEGIAHIELGDAEKAKASFAKALAADDPVHWPGPIAAMMVQQRTRESVLEQAERNPSPSLRLDRLCEVGYYGGYAALMNGDRAKALARWKEAVDTQSLVSREWEMAAAAVERHGGR